MKKIASFTIDHLNLFPGLYLSRRDAKDGVTVTTFDLRFTAPNREPAADIAALHTIEHLFATYLRNSESADDIVYFGPMGCRTGCYLLVFGEKTPEDVLPSVLGACDFTLAFDGEIPGAQAAECGNWLEHNLPLAKYYAARYKAELLEHRRFTYPQKGN